MAKNFLTGFMEFAGAWVEICSELLKNKQPWKFEVRAPKGPTRKIIYIATAALFVTAAKRAMANNRLFEGASLVEPYLAGELQPHGLAVSALSEEAKRKAVMRIRKIIADDMAVLVFFGLFEETEKRKAYRLTDVGVGYYERLSGGGGVADLQAA
jgi:hypothetical protein